MVPALMQRTSSASIEQQTTDDTRIPVLDGVRGVAILMVMLHHFAYGATAQTFLGRATLVTFEGGHLGVDLFFVLSGFLITRILLRTRLDQHYFRNFYARRALRIFPLYYAYLIFYFGFVTRFTHFDSARTTEASSYQLWIWLYATNILICLRGGFIVASVNHFWSLAVEEHFYLLWPALVRRFDARRMLLICGASFIIAIACRGLITWQNWSPYAANVFTFCRIDALSAGALLAVFERLYPAEAIVRGARWTLWTLLGLVALGAMAFNGQRAWGNAAETIGYSVTALIFAALIALVVWGTRPNALWRVFQTRFLCWLGTYAYGLYVFHHPIRIVLQRLLPFEKLGRLLHSYVLGLVVHGLLSGAISIVVALLSYHLFEQRILRLKRFF
jgi:peptidoglycan/LPS O-acetylase OafA/YrhL